jgi:hypothetical protein
MPIKTAYLVLNTDKPIAESASKLRGCIANRFPEYSILHHHLREVGYLYTYPRIQYKVIGRTAFILGIEEGVRVLKEIYDRMDTLLLGRSVYKVERKVLQEQDEEVASVKNLIQYKFLTPWLALNQENYSKFQALGGWKEKKAMLNRILIGNVLSMCKGLGVVVEKELYSHIHVDSEKVEYKSTCMMGFVGKFKINLKIPDYFGLGKGVSQGFGVVLKTPNV